MIPFTIYTTFNAHEFYANLCVGKQKSREKRLAIIQRKGMKKDSERLSKTDLD